ncbi:MAG: glycosyltransferase, partial [Bacteroidaceae bacterium]|nr:glycosyltransferase [Bacteroidaceae bacterium]
MDKLLFIRYRRPDNIDAGGEQGTNTNYRVLCHIFGEENILVYYIHESLSKKILFLHAFSIFINFFKGYYYGLSQKKVDSITALAMPFSYVFIDRSIFGIISKALKDKHYTGKIITFFHNVESVYFKAKIGKSKPWCPIVVNCVTKNDQQACDYSDIIIALNERDKQEIENRYHRSPDILSPVVFQDKYNNSHPDFEKMTRNIPVCLFLGTYFPMNVHGIIWFVREVLPEVNIKLQIVGKGMKAILPMVTNLPNIEVYSDVANLKPYIENADFMLLPIFEGSGMKVKTCE